MGVKLIRSNEKDASNGVMPRVRVQKVGDLISSKNREV